MNHDFSRDQEALLTRWLPALESLSGLDGAMAVQDWVTRQFEPAGVSIDFEDGSVVAFRWSFWIADPGDRSRVAVFTEHCGHHEFFLGPEDHISRMHTVRCHT